MSKAITWSGFFLKLVQEYIQTTCSNLYKSFMKIFKKHDDGIIAMSLIFIFATSLVWMMSITSSNTAENLKTQTQKAAETKKKAEEETKKPKLTIDMALSTVKNSVSADKICYDEKQNGYLMYWTKPTKGNTREGWYIMTGVDFYPMSNGKFFIKNVNAIPDTPITLDSVEGLPCIQGRSR